MLPNVQQLQDLGQERQRALMQWREEQRLLANLPRKESTLETLSRQVVATIRKLESMGQPRVSAPSEPRPERLRRGA